MQGNQTGIFFINASAQGAGLKEFPREFRKRLFSDLDARYLVLLVICAVIIGGTTFIFSLRPLSEEATDKEILKIQERYAQLVLNQPKPVPVDEKKAEAPSRAASSAVAEETAPADDVDRAKESFVQKQERKTASAETRQRKRQAIADEVASTGIFAAITATGGKGARGGGVSDLLGAADGVGGLGDVDISSGTFATNDVSAANLAARTGSRTGGVGIQRSAVGTAEGAEIASAGAVTVTTQPAEIKNESPSAGGSKSCIFRIINRQNSRLKRAYETWLKREPQLAGRLKVKLTILPSGNVTGVSVSSSNMNSPDFEETVLRYIRQWKFEGCSISEPIEIEVPFVFEGMQ